jgi:aminomethyltransferase
MMLRTPLYDAHVRLNAKIVPFAGYDMPVQYASVIHEAKAVRHRAGMFDVSHMARLRLVGSTVFADLENLTTNDVSALEDGVGQYSLLPNESGGVVDDIIVYRINAFEFYVVVNAANHEKDVAWITSHLDSSVHFTDETDGTAMIAVQGPSAAEIVGTLSDAPLDQLPLFGVANASVAGIACFIARSGYTGEDGFEIICPADQADALWTALHAAGVEPCGLASRDTLRVEAGLPLFGHELTDETSPIAAGLGWVVSKTKSFIGSDHVNQVREAGPVTKLQGIRLETKRLLMPGMAVNLDGEKIGEITSGVYSPMLDCGIAFAYLRSDVKLKTSVTVDIRGKQEPATVVSKRFYKRES